MGIVIHSEGHGLPEHKFYGGRETCCFDRESWVWYWRHPSEGLVKLDGVSSVVKVCTPVKPLMVWAVRLATEKTKELLIAGGHVGLDANTALTEQILDDILERARKEDNERLEDAGQVGHEAHAHIENIIKAILRSDEEKKAELLANLPADERAANGVCASICWQVEHKVEWISTERPCFSRKHRVAGTSDGLAYVSSCQNLKCCPVPFERRLSLVDWKTSNALRIGYLWQAACYRGCIEEEDGVQIEDTWILRLDKETGDFDPWHAEGRALWERHFQGYLNALSTVRSMAETERWVSGVKDVRRVEKAEADAKEKAILYAVKCPKADEYKGKRKKTCNGGEGMCQACQQKFDEGHNDTKGVEVQDQG